MIPLISCVIFQHINPSESSMFSIFSAFADGQKMSLDEGLDLALKTVEEMNVGNHDFVWKVILPLSRHSELILLMETCDRI